MQGSRSPIELVIDAAHAATAEVEGLAIGLTWTTCATVDAVGLAMSPHAQSRVLTWPGSIRGRPAGEVARWLGSWSPFEATVGLAAANAVINRAGNPLMERAQTIAGTGPANLAVFEHFRPELSGAKVVVIGRYPGLDEVLSGLDYVVLERSPEGRDLPDTAAEEVVPKADWVFITATALINKTLPRLLELSRGSRSVLMGPSTPWLSEWAEYGVDYLAGVRVVDRDRLLQIAAEGGGTRVFGEGVRYAVAPLA